MWNAVYNKIEINFEFNVLASLLRVLIIPIVLAARKPTAGDRE